MFKHKMDLIIKILTLPFSEFGFYKSDYIEKLASIKKVDECNKYYNEDFMNNVYKLVHKTQRISNLDEINMLMKRIYPKEKIRKFYERDKGIATFYFDYISKLAESFISHRGSKIVFKYWEIRDEEELLGPYKGLNKVAIWNSLNRMFTTDILVASYLLDNDMTDERYLNGYYSLIAMEDLQLEQILSKGVAETHMHMGAGIHFFIKWQDLMNLTEKRDDAYSSSLFADTVVDKNFGLENYVKAVAILRLTMADFLQDNCNLYKDYVDYIKKCILESDQLECVNEDIHTIIYDLYKGNIISSKKYLFSSIFEKFEYYLGSKSGKKCTGKRFFNDDILSRSVFQYYSDMDTTMENIFIFKSVKYIRENNEDRLFCKLFLQYLRIKNEVFQCIVQGNLIKGLNNFQHYYSRATRLNVNSAVQHWNIVIRNQMQNQDLKKLEIRIHPGDAKNKESATRQIVEKLKGFFEVYKELLKISLDMNSGELPNIKNIPAMGLVFSFLKRADIYDVDKCWLNYDGTNRSWLSYSELQDAYIKQAEAIVELRENIPNLSQYIVGVDAASVENNTEPWVFAPVYHSVRNSKTHKLKHLKSASEVKELGFTYHVGEDFRSILTGLRRIDEVIEHLRFRASDRIGHGIALGINVDKWVHNNRVVTLPRIEHLENLLWLWGFYKNGKELVDYDMEYLEKEILEQAEKIYIKLEGITVYSLWKTYRRKFEIFHVNEKYKLLSEEQNGKYLKKDIEIFCPHVCKEEAVFWNEEKLMHAQHCKCYLDRMNYPIQFIIKQEDVEMLSQIQKIMAEKVSRNGIIVETNPTSNNAIGEIENIFEHYIHNLNRRGLSNEINPENAAIITINSDDPCVFNTNVSNEFAYIFYSLLEKGYSREDILLWIDKVRNYGMISSFIDDRNLSGQKRLEEIEQILEYLET